MSISKDLIILLGALLIAGAVPVATLAVVAPMPEQRTSDVMRRSGTAAVQRDGAGSHDNVVTPDTLRHTVRGGEVLIIDLPEELDGRPVDGYSLIHAPALSWLVDYSFMWRTLPEDAGMHDVLIRADGPSDTLVVSINVE